MNVYIPSFSPFSHLAGAKVKLLFYSTSNFEIIFEFISNHSFSSFLKEHPSLAGCKYKN